MRIGFSIINYALSEYLIPSISAQHCIAITKLKKSCYITFKPCSSIDCRSTEDP